MHQQALTAKDIEIMELDSLIKTYDERLSMSTDQSDKLQIKSLQSELINLVDSANLTTERRLFNQTEEKPSDHRRT